jgi:hypothetical protein
VTTGGKSRLDCRSREAKVDCGYVSRGRGAGAVRRFRCIRIGRVNYLIVGDENVGGFPRFGTVRDAIRVFGQPTTRVSMAFDQCRLTWVSSGVTMKTYYTGAGLDPCGPNGRRASTTVTDPRWRTSAKLKLRDPRRRMRMLYPKAVRTRPGVWRLTARPFAGVALPGLEARIVNGRVASLTVYGPRSPF